MISIFNGRERTFGGEKSKVYAQVGVGFRQYLHHFKGAKLGVFMAISLHANENGWAWPSVSLLSQETGYNAGTINTALNELCAMTIDGHRVLLKWQPKQKDSGQFHNNHYLLFPSPAEVAEYKDKGMRNTVNNLPSMENTVTVKPADKEEPSSEVEPTEHVANATPATDDATDEQCTYWREEEEFGMAVRICADCGRQKHTTADMPDVHNACTCDQERALAEAFGDPPPPTNPPDTLHWREQAKQPGADWGEQSPEFQRQLAQYGAAGRKVQQLGADFERITGLHPLWDDKHAVKRWATGLWTTLQEADGDPQTVIEATKQMQESELTIASPWSVREMARALAASKRIDERDGGGKPKPYSDEWYTQQMANDPQAAAFRGMYD